MAKSKAILVDYHNTIINKDNHYNCTDFINALAKSYKIIVWTAAPLSNGEAILKNMADNNLHYDKFVYENDNSGDDVDIKIKLYNAVKNNYRIEYIIDNNKAVCRKFAKMGIATLRYKDDD